jgi:hypothetical protein
MVNVGDDGNISHIHFFVSFLNSHHIGKSALSAFSAARRLQISFSDGYR